MGENLQLQPEEIREVAGQLISMLAPQAIYLYNQRVGDSGRAQGFKLCIIAQTEDKQEMEKRAYMEIDCDIPFDLLLYTPAEWEALLGNDASFAHKIYRTGTKIYGE